MAFESNNIDQGQLLLLQKQIKSLVDVFYPVGSLLWSSSPSSPADRFPGTSWKKTNIAPAAFYCWERTA